MPFVVENHSPFPHFAFVKTGPDGSDFQVLAARATFDWAHDGDMTVAAQQEPVVLADRVEDGELRLEADLVIGKPRADIVVIGDACSPTGEPAPDWTVGLRVGSLSKALRVTGPRYWEHGAFGHRLTSPDRALRVPLRYHLAYGGTRRRVTSRGPEEDVFEPNPVGVGYTGRFPFDEPLWPAPRIEALEAPIRALSDRPRPEGLGPIARFWLPRRARAGSLTEAFVRANPKKLPPDFDWEYYNSAHPDLMYPGFLEGDEHVGTVGLFPEGRSGSKLPGYRAMAVLSLASGAAVSAAPKLDTLAIDTIARKVHATWRLTVPAALRARVVVLGFSVQPPARPAGDVLYPLRSRA